MRQGGGIGMGGGLGAVPAVTESAKTLLCVVALAWAARTKQWEAWFGRRLPGLLRFARFSALLATILGVGYLVLTFYAQVFISPQLIANVRVGRSAVGPWLIAGQVALF